ncbi:MAG: hypothetical protein GTN73_08115 [Candidatus Aminicenantes bacterium]|nr:hypothetical protein [Candidatus Aminicenantes bacterium]
MKLKRIAVFLFLFFLLASPCARSLACFEQKKEPSFQKKDVPTIELDLFNLVNLEREKLGIAPVRYSPPLSFLARKHSQDMALRGDISHLSTSGETYSERLVDAGFYFIKNGENVAFSQTFIPEFIHKGFMDGPGHRETVLDPDFDELGIGVVFKKDKGYYVTQDFVQALAAKGRIEAEAEVEENINRIRRVYSLPPISFLKEANRYAQQCSINKAKSKPLPSPPPRFGETHIVHIRSPSFEYVYSKYKDKLLNINYETGGLGIEFRRNKESPGGTYYITLLLFPENKHKSKSNKDLSEIVLRAINDTRESKGLTSLIADKKLTARAEQALKIIYSQMNDESITVPRLGSATVISYITTNPNLLSDELKAKIENNFIDFTRIGIGILFGKNPKFPRGAFWVAILLEE